MPNLNKVIEKINKVKPETFIALGLGLKIFQIFFERRCKICGCPISLCTGRNK